MAPSRDQTRTRIREAVADELRASFMLEQAGDPALSFHHLERAHIVGQRATTEHVRTHVHMLRWAMRHGDRRETVGQIVRIAAAATKTVLGLVPAGNTGGSNVSPFRTMPVPADLQRLIDAARTRQP